MLWFIGEYKYDLYNFNTVCISFKIIYLLSIFYVPPKHKHDEHSSFQQEL